MIVVTMTPEEKVKQMKKLLPMLKEIVPPVLERNIKKLLRVKVFPSFLTKEVDIEGMGHWTLVIEAETRSAIKKGIVAIFAYQKFFIHKAKNPLNNGTGIYVFNSDDQNNVTCYEYSPHFFNRLRERYVEPKGITQPPFPDLVKMLLKMTSSAMDISVKGLKPVRDSGGYKWVRDEEHGHYKGKDDLITVTREGILYGTSEADRRYFGFTTYIGVDDFREDQRELVERELKKLREIEYKRRLDPLYHGGVQGCFADKNLNPLT